MAADATVPAPFRVRAVAALLDLDSGAEWLPELLRAAMSTDRDTAAHAAGALVTHGDHAGAQAGIDTALRLLATRGDDSPAMLCARLVLARGRPDQADRALRSFLATPHSTTIRWEALVNTRHQGAAAIGLAALDRLLDERDRTVSQGIRAAATLLSRGLRDASVRVLVSAALDPSVEPDDRIDALDELLSHDVDGPWAATLADVAAGCAADHVVACLSGAEILGAHDSDAACAILRSVLDDPHQDATSRARAAASLLVLADQADVAAVHDTLAEQLTAVGLTAFERFLLAEPLAGSGDATRARAADAVLLAIAHDPDIAVQDRFFAARALFRAERTLQRGAASLLGLASTAEPRYRLWVAEVFIGFGVVHPAFWSRL